MSLEDLQEKLQEVKIQIGVQEKLLQQKLRALKKTGVKNVKQAEKKLKELDDQLAAIDTKREKWLRKAQTIIETIEDEDLEIRRPHINP